MLVVRAPHRASALGTILLIAAVIFASGSRMFEARRTSAASLFQLDYVDDGKQLKLLVRHAEMGLVCELWCYEGGPFQYGKGSKREDGSVVLVHTSGKMTATTTFTPNGGNRVLMDVLVQGPIEELRKVVYMGPCMQFWHSEKFKREDTLGEFARRCFLYTMRGPVGMIDTARGPMKDFKPEAPENNPPCTQWYVPIGRVHPGDIWAFGTSGDRPLYGVVGVASRDNRWLAAIGCAHTRTLGQGWHDCIHHVLEMQAYFNDNENRIRHRSVLYVMPNDKRKLLDSFRQDFPDGEGSPQIVVSLGKDGTLLVRPSSRNDSEVSLSLNIVSEMGQQQEYRAVSWEASPWGGFVRRGRSSEMWAYPSGEALQLWVTLVGRATSPGVEAKLGGKGWVLTPRLADVPILVHRSPDASFLAALMWERSKHSNPALGVFSPSKDSDGAQTIRARLYLSQVDLDKVRDRWTATKEEWQHSLPYRMPVEASLEPGKGEGVRLMPSAEDQMAYGLTIVSPWNDGGTIHANFPEHFEHGDVGYGILRYSDKRNNAWRISPDGRSAHYEVESQDLPGVRITASAVAQGNGARLTLKITNGSDKTLKGIKPLLCFWYAKMAGFAGKFSDNFKYTYVVRDGKPIALSNIPTNSSEATAKVAYVRGCNQHDCDKFARSRGGLIDRDIDQALIVVTARDGKRKVVIAFTPGKSILSNTAIPCAHADPYFGTLQPGASSEVTGMILFSERSIPEALEELTRSLYDRRGI